MDAYDLIISGTQLRKLITKYVEPIIEEYGLRPVELDILEFITRENLTTAKEIMLRRHLSKSHISKSLEHLLEKGFIKIHEDENDHRVMRISLTDDSYKLIDRINEAYEKCRTILLREISEDELHIFREVIHKMNNNVDGELKKQDEID